MLPTEDGPGAEETEEESVGQCVTISELNEEDLAADSDGEDYTESTDSHLSSCSESAGRMMVMMITGSCKAEWTHARYTFIIIYYILMDNDLPVFYGHWMTIIYC